MYWFDLYIFIKFRGIVNTKGIININTRIFICP